MPFIKTISLPNNGTIGIWENTETVEELTALLQPKGELLQKLESIKLPKRQEELCITQLLIRKLYGKPLHILKDENGKPYLNEPLSISISHSDKYSAVMLTNNTLECGIDVEIIDPRMERLHKKFVSDYENQPPKGEENTYYSIIWCLKEAIYKWYAKRGLDFKTNMIIHPFEIAEKGSVKFNFKKEEIDITETAHYEIFDNHIIAYTMSELAKVTE